MIAGMARSYRSDAPAMTALIQSAPHVERALPARLQQRRSVVGAAFCRDGCDRDSYKNRSYKNRSYKNRSYKNRSCKKPFLQQKPLRPVLAQRQLKMLTGAGFIPFCQQHLTHFGMQFRQAFNAQTGFQVFLRFIQFVQP